MSDDSSTRCAYVFDLRHPDTHAVLGVGVVIPSLRYASVLTGSSADARSSELSAEEWNGIDDWVAEGNAGLPARPAPMSPAIVAALLGDGNVSAERFAAIPFTDLPRPELVSRVNTMLDELLRVRRSAA